MQQQQQHQAKQGDQHQKVDNMVSDHYIWQSIFECYSATADLDEAFAINAQPLNIISSEYEQTFQQDAKQLLDNEYELVIPALCDPLQDIDGSTGAPQDPYHNIINESWDHYSHFMETEEEKQPQPQSIVELQGSLVVDEVNPWQEWPGSDPLQLQEYYCCDNSSSGIVLPDSKLSAGNMTAKLSFELEPPQQQHRASSSTSCNQNQSARSEISYRELSQYFHMPITQAARELKVGLTVLKKRCREFGIPRWPHRKMKSIGNLIRNIQELAKSNGGVSQARFTNAVEILQEQYKLMEEMPGIELAERTKRLRQACFKANYKKRRAAAQITTTTSSSTTSSSSGSTSSTSSSIGKKMILCPSTPQSFSSNSASSSPFSSSSG